VRLAETRKLDRFERAALRERDFLVLEQENANASHATLQALEAARRRDGCGEFDGNQTGSRRP
jgi:hypothetical protein